MEHEKVQCSELETIDSNAKEEIRYLREQINKVRSLASKLSGCTFDGSDESETAVGYDHITYKLKENNAELSQINSELNDIIVELDKTI